MAEINWYPLFNREEFLASDIESKTASIQFEGIGIKSVLITKGNLVGVTIDDVFLTCEMNGKNPFRLNDKLIYVDANEIVWWGIINET